MIISDSRLPANNNGAQRVAFPAANSCYLRLGLKLSRQLVLSICRVVINKLFWTGRHSDWTLSKSYRHTTDRFVARSLF
jgi:hypothetical protein